MKRKAISLWCLLIGAALLAAGLAAPLLPFVNNSSPNIGIIGGADTPTYLFLLSHAMNGLFACLVMLGASLTVTGAVTLIFRKTVETHCSKKATGIALGLSAVSALGLVCAFLWFAFTTFHETAKHPIAYPLSITVGLISLVVFVILIVAYFQERMQHWSVKGLILDVLTSILYLPAFFYIFSCLLN